MTKMAGVTQAKPPFAKKKQFSPARTSFSMLHTPSRIYFQFFELSTQAAFSEVAFDTLRQSESVKCRFSVLNLKFDFISDGGCTREKQIQKALGSLPPCGNRCRFSESAICSSRVHPPSEIKSNFEFKTLKRHLLRWRLTLSETKEQRAPK